MICPSINKADLLLDYTAGRLDDDEKIGIERHMAECPACASFRIEQAAVWDALDLWEPAPVSVDFNRRLWLRIETYAVTPWYRSFAESLRVGNWKPLVSLTAAMLVIAAGFVFDHPASRNAVEGITIRQADQVEQALDDMDLLHQLDAVVTPAAANSKPM